MPIDTYAEVLRTLTHPREDADGYGTPGRAAWLDVDWARHRHRLPVRGREVEYVDIGSGPAIVWIHGLGACWQTWLENLPFFARDHRCVALDLPGFGRSEMPAEPVTIERYAAIVDELLGALGIDRAVVAGNSMGGFIGAELAIRFPARAERLVLVSAAVFWQEYRRAKPLVTLARTSDAYAGRALASSSDSVARRPRLRHVALAFAGIRYPNLLSRELQVELVRTARRTPGFLPALEALASYPLRDELPRISCPTLVVWGTDDTLVGVRHASELEELIPDARKVVMKRTGHTPMLERPERFNRAVAEFIAG